MTPSQLLDKYKIFTDEQLHYLSSMHRRQADTSQRESTFINRELKRRNKERRSNHEDSSV
ncbi:MAG: hypothetical protein RL563_2222 [Pseudomonadota bacterium]|jgi:hypothetical protein